MVRGFVFAGGYGNRLRNSIPDYDDIPKLMELREWSRYPMNPKCLLPVNGKALLEYSIASLPAELDEIVVSTFSSQKDKVVSRVSELGRDDVSLRVFDGNRYLDIRDAFSLYEDALMLMHSDTIGCPDASQRLLRRFLEGNYDILTFVYDDFIRDGLVDVEEGVVKGIDEKVKYVGQSPVIFGYTPRTINGIDRLFERTTEDNRIEGETSIIKEVLKGGGTVGYELMPENVFNVDTIEIFLRALCFIETLGERDE